MVSVLPSLRDPQATLQAVQGRLEDALQAIEALWQDRAGRAADVLGERDLPWLIRHAAGGGKMLRPEMVHWGWVSAGGTGEAHDSVVTLGAAVELLHLFALMHDDIMDRSDMRRGQASIHALARSMHGDARARGDARTFGDAIAILCGDLVLSEVSAMVADLPHPVRQAWRQMVFELVLGQRRDLTGAALGRRDLQHALEVARLKSGAYSVAGPLRMGALLAGADGELLECLERYAWHVGEAFGLRDDLLGVWGDPSATGKSAADDLVSGKATVLLALAHEQLSVEGMELLAKAGSEALDDQDLARLRRDMDACGVREAVEDMIIEEVDLASGALDPAFVTADGIEGLGTIAHKIAWRQK